MSTLILHKETIAGECVVLTAIYDVYLREEVPPVFRVEHGKGGEEINTFRDFDSVPAALDYYNKVKKDLSFVHYKLSEHLKYCRDEEMTPHMAAEYLFKQGYGRTHA